jgi:hypothetical protein
MQYRDNRKGEANAPEAWRHGIGRAQSSWQPSENTTVRPNIISEYTYDEDSQINGVSNAADEWIIAGDFSGETWEDDNEMTDDLAQVMCDYLQIPEQQQPAIKATMDAVVISHAEMWAIAGQWDSEVS